MANIVNAQSAASEPVPSGIVAEQHPRDVAAHRDFDGAAQGRAGSAPTLTAVDWDSRTSHSAQAPTQAMYGYGYAEWAAAQTAMYPAATAQSWGWSAASSLPWNVDNGAANAAIAGASTSFYTPAFSSQDQSTSRIPAHHNMSPSSPSTQLPFPATGTGSEAPIGMHSPGYGPAANVAATQHMYAMLGMYTTPSGDAAASAKAAVVGAPSTSLAPNTPATAAILQIRRGDDDDESDLSEIDDDDDDDDDDDEPLAKKKCVAGIGGHSSASRASSLTATHPKFKRKSSHTPAPVPPTASSASLTEASGAKQPQDSVDQRGSTSQHPTLAVEPVHQETPAASTKLTSKASRAAPKVTNTTRKVPNASSKVPNAASKVPNAAPKVSNAASKASNSVSKTSSLGSKALSMGMEILVPEFQNARCMATRYKSNRIPRCVSCIRRWAGDTCRFQGLRWIMRDAGGECVSFSFARKAPDNPPFVLPAAWNVPIEPRHVKRVKSVVARALLPVLHREQEHVKHADIVPRLREQEVRATCDTCMTSIFSETWMCRLCGRELCGECFTQLRAAGPAGGAAATARREALARVRVGFVACSKGREHGPGDFCPLTRFAPAELAGAVREMERLVAQEDEQAADVPETLGTLMPAEPPALPLYPASGLPEAPAAVPATAVPSHPTRLFTDGELSEDAFRALWARGDPLVIGGLLSKLALPWSPAWFVAKYGTQACKIVDCQTEKSKDTHVADFFATFGHYTPDRRQWKLKDWPPATDFKSEFPELFEDFCNTAPIPSYVRRDGAFNLASHFPSNVIGPDLGPKMYNAQATTDNEGSFGSTRLHMDMSDAMNIMTHACATPRGAPGYAIWDIFKAGDAGKLRRFLRARFSIPDHVDPIHAQKWYLDAALRRELHAQEGVVSHRIYQVPGQAVFIPAGCAHQVANAADCVKVAVDFVSPENIARCETLTREFRELNQVKAWKEDVLQLRTMMWFAWLSCCREEKRLSL